MEIVKEAMVCHDCWDYIMGNDDALEYHEVPEERIKHIGQSFNKWVKIENPDGTLSDGQIVNGDEHEEFSWKACEICQSCLGGERFELALLN